MEGGIPPIEGWCVHSRESMHACHQDVIDSAAVQEFWMFQDDTSPDSIRTICKVYCVPSAQDVPLWSPSCLLAHKW